MINLPTDRTDKARMDQINSVKKYMKKINKKMKAQGTNIVEAKKAAKVKCTSKTPATGQ